MLKQRPSHYLLFFLSLILYAIIGYGIQRHQTLSLFLCYFSLFILYLRIAQLDEYRFWIAASILFRAVLLFSVPALSDDFYRFIWDGRLLAAGYHPFAHIPSFYVEHGLTIPGIDAELFNKLNSKETFTVYPPVAQFIFWLSVKLSGGSLYGCILVMKAVLFAFEIATLWLFVKVLRQYHMPSRTVLLYALNPLVVVELTGNLHHEGIMVFFLLLGVYGLARIAPAMSAVAWSFSVCTKLIPLIFLPLFPRYFGWKKSMFLWVITGVCTALLFAPLLNGDIVRGLSTSLGYYFHRFEFNASIYYLLRALGYLAAGFNIIHYAGPLLGITATVAILKISFGGFPHCVQGHVDKTLFVRMLWVLFAWLLCTTILHPWYIITLLAISLFTPYRFTVVWTAMIFLTYQGYTENSFRENLWLIALEYCVVIGYLSYEMVWIKSRNRS
jgi:alpha-1,6-mannosyltransferase